MLDSAKKIWFYIISLFFIIANGLLLYNERFEFIGFPILVSLVYLAIFKLDIVYYIVIFLVPISINLDELGVDLGIGIALPTEPLIVGMMLIFILKLFFDGNFDKQILRHPITKLIILHILWMALTTITSSDSVVSVKFLLSRFWYISVFFFIASQVLKSGKTQKRTIWLYVLGFIPVLLYTFQQHALRGFDQASANWVMNPFFNDHTSYGACLSMIFPFLLWQCFSKRIQGVKKLMIWIVSSLFLAALIFSYTRAAWVSLIGAFGVFIILRFKIKTWMVLSFSFLLGLFLFSTMDSLLMDLESNKQDSSSNLTEHVESISNVSSDASNLERINRWKSAWEMFQDKPVFGFGPGTYTFEYAPYQQSKNKTIISTNAGDGGNAHSEYLGPLSEQGVIGCLLFILFIFSVIAAGVRVYKSHLSKESRMIGLSVLLGLVTYYLHGILNNFLDTDKASALFWGFSVILMVLDIKRQKLHKDQVI